MSSSPPPAQYGGGAEAPRSVWQAMAHGFRTRCPSCGAAPLFSGFLKVTDQCDHCGEELFHHRADDMPPYLTIFIVGHVVLPLAVAIELAYQPNVWLQGIGWCLLAITMSLVLLPRLKGAVVGLQWANRMHGFGGVDEFEPGAVEASAEASLNKGSAAAD